MVSRRVELVFVSDDVDPGAMRDALNCSPDEMIWRGAPPAAGRRWPSREHVCVFREFAASEDDFASVLLERLHSRVVLMADGMVDLASKGCRVKLSVFQEIVDGNASDGSFVLDTNWLGILSGVGAVVDVDLISTV
jgi:hypothetical protein